MNLLKNLTLFAVLAVLAALSSCRKDEVFNSNIDTPVVDPKTSHKNGLLERSVSSNDGLELGCVTVTYPFGMLLLDSTTVQINSEDEFIDVLEDMINPPIDFTYPLSLTDSDGNLLTAADLEELAALFVDCIPNVGWDDYDDWFFPAWLISFDNSCYQLVYPVTLLNTDSVAVVANDEDALVALLSDGDIYSFSFPLNLEDENGNSVTADDQETLFDLLTACGPGPNHGEYGIGTIACYEIVYPATLKLYNGSTVVVNNDNEYASVLFSSEAEGFVYPLQLKDQDDNPITINSDEELGDALEDCSPNSSDGDLLCYDHVYPISVIDFTFGTTFTFNNEQEWDAFISNNGNSSNTYEYAFPLTLVRIETGELITLQSEDELIVAIQDCF